MDEAKLKRLREELEKARKKRDTLDARIKDLERRYAEAEKVCVYAIYREACLTPEQLAAVIRSAGILPELPPEAETDLIFSETGEIGEEEAEE